MSPRSASRPGRLRALGAAALSAGLALLLALGGVAPLVPLSALLPIEERPEEHHRTPEAARVALALAAEGGCRAGAREAVERPGARGRRPAPRARLAGGGARPPDLHLGFRTPLRC
ncbi:MAG: hypothetical protein M9894_14150 [Planctomycetes bacterium]|nr:hypothetical protein [Planctomycetota bacterium]